MTSIRIVLACLLVFATTTAAATEPAAGKLGVGAILGEPTGLTAKYWLGKDRAVDGGLAYSFDDFFLVYSDYLLHFPGALTPSAKVARELLPYVGVGALFEVSTSDDNGRFNEDDDDDVALGVRIPLGLEWLPSSAPLGFSIEIVPGLTVVPDTDAFLQAGLAARYYF